MEQPYRNDVGLAALAAAETVALLDIATDPGAHPPLRLYGGKLDQLEDGKFIRDPAP